MERTSSDDAHVSKLEGLPVTPKREDATFNTFFDALLKDVKPGAPSTYPLEYMTGCFNDLSRNRFHICEYLKGCSSDLLWSCVVTMLENEKYKVIVDWTGVPWEFRIVSPKKFFKLCINVCSQFQKGTPFRSVVTYLASLKKCSWMGRPLLSRVDDKKNTYVFFARDPDSGGERFSRCKTNFYLNLITARLSEERERLRMRRKRRFDEKDKDSKGKKEGKKNTISVEDGNTRSNSSVDIADDDGDFSWSSGHSDHSKEGGSGQTDANVGIGSFGGPIPGTYGNNGNQMTTATFSDLVPIDFTEANGHSITDSVSPPLHFPPMHFTRDPEEDKERSTLPYFPNVLATAYHMIN